MTQRQEREILMSSREEYQSEQAGREGGGPGGTQGQYNTQITFSHPHPLSGLRAETQTGTRNLNHSTIFFLHDVVVSVIEDGVFRGNVCPHVVGER